jgi:predicted metal-dependent peptidase
MHRGVAVAQVDQTVRALTKEEREKYAAGVVYAISVVPSFRDVIALLRPFYDGTADTAYVDTYSRVGLSHWFLNEINTYQRASVILHEAMHVLNNHFTRGDAVKAHPKILGIAGDFEINCGLDRLPRIDLPVAIFPDQDPFNYPRNKTLEQYVHLLMNDMKDEQPEPDQSCPQHGEPSDGEGSGDDPESGDSSESGSESGSSSGGSEDSETGEGDSESGDDKGSGKGGHSSGECTCSPGKPGKGGSVSPCDHASEDRASKADDAGIERASDVEQSIAKKNTHVRVIEELKNGRQRGNESQHDFLTLAQRFMAPPKVKWQTLFRRAVAKANDSVSRGRSDYSYRRVNRRAHGSEFIFPGMIQYTPTVMLGIDSSGSMGSGDYNLALNETEGILKAAGKGKEALKMFFIDAKVGTIQPCKTVKDLKLTGGGGTDMSVGVDYVNKLSRREKPDIFVLITDGGTNWVSYEQRIKESRKSYLHILLVTQKYAFDQIPEVLRRQVTAIDISGDM